MSSTESPTMPTINSPNLIAPLHPSCIKQHPSFLINFFVISLHHSLPFLMVKVYFILFLFLLSYHHFYHLFFLSSFPVFSPYLTLFSFSSFPIFSLYLFFIFSFLFLYLFSLPHESLPCVSFFFFTICKMKL